MGYKNDLEKAYQLFEFKLDKEDLYYLFFDGYDRMLLEHKKRPGLANVDTKKRKAIKKNSINDYN